MAKSKKTFEADGILIDKAVEVENLLETELGNGLELAQEDSKGNTFLPSLEPVVIKELVDAVFEVEQHLKPVFASARDDLKVINQRIMELSHRHIDLFSEPDEKGQRVYVAGGVVVKITFEKEKIVTKLEDDGLGDE